MISKYRWKNRLFISLHSDGILVKQQKALLDNVISELMERDLILIGFDGSKEPYSSDPPIDPKKLKQELSKTGDSFILVGKDGTVKSSWRLPVDPKIIFEIIDAMPMRKIEIQKKKGLEWKPQ